MTPKTYIVEHLDDELGPWSELEYLTIAKESNEAGARFCLSSIPPSLALPPALKAVPGFTAETRSVETIYADSKPRVCLLDPSAKKELSPEDGDVFDTYLFGGILGELSLGGPQTNDDLHVMLIICAPGDDPPRGMCSIYPVQ
jgi:ribosome biogenesis SPOUT family RNA methylase Rps3